MEKNKAKPYFQKGIFCIKLLVQESEQREEYPAISVGVDPGSKREGYTALTAKGVILNITTNTPDWVSAHLETRRNLRRARRNRKTPYRACRENRSALRKTDRVPPSTKARWDAKLRILKLLFRILPITHLNIEDIQAATKAGKKRWNKSFSPLETGKQYFYQQIVALYSAVQIIKTLGWQTSNYRKSRQFPKSKNKLDYSWAAHNSDSHSLAEIALQTEVEPYLGLYKIEFLQFYRRQLHVQNYAAGHIRKKYGTTVSCGMSRGAVLKDIKSGRLYYLGGSSRAGYISIHDIKSKKRVNQNKKVSEVKMLYNNKYGAQFLPCHSKQWQGFPCKDR